MAVGGRGCHADLVGWQPAGRQPVKSWPVRWRAAASVLGAVVLASAIVVLRGQVPPAPQQAATPPQPVVLADPGLPVRDPVREPRWRTFTPLFGAIDGAVGPQHVVYTRAAGDRLELTVLSRDSGEQLLRHSVLNDDAPWSSLMHDGLLLVAFGRQQVRLVVLDPVTDEVRELVAPAGYGFRPRLVDLGDEVLLLGWHTAPRQSCVLAAQPRTGVTRVVWCAERGSVPAWLYDGVDEVVWPAQAGLPNSCPRWQRLRLGGEVEAVPPKAPLCGARGLVELDDWQVTQRAEPEVLTPMIVATDGQLQIALGTAGAFVACGRHIYWAAATRGIDPDTVYRWLPGAEYREVAYRLESTGRLMLATPHCTDGVLSVAVTTTHGPRLVELRSLGRP